ncbi:cobalt-precorrin-6A reductase [Sulfitobacter sp.]|uniref:cobalt-precorrin-6A reductase n=1 Tax=Sulfitobacter sp. TaxID=1903071 RepID=UPI003297A60B
MRVLLLGGTTEASQLAQALHTAGIETVFSYAGRTNAPVAQPVPVRVGGFGGVAGLMEYLVAEGISHVVDATHPFANTMAHNVHQACTARTLPLMRLERPAWALQHGDDWRSVPDIASVCAALPDTPARVFLAIGRMHIDQFAAQPQHHYVLRLVDHPTAPIPLPNHSVIVARGPFDVVADKALMLTHGIEYLVAKNAGGSGAAAKITAARDLGLPVIMIDRPHRPNTVKASDIETVLHWLRHDAERGV